MSHPLEQHRKPSAFDGAVRKGREAFKAGQPKSACPYEDHRKPSGRLSWSRAFIRAWQDGWDSASLE